MSTLIHGYEVVIGLETHTQLSTLSKQFSDAPTAFGAAPNTQATFVDLALPGVLPVMNKASVEKAIAFGLAIGATINTRSTFERKNYFYPDLPKGYQISQFITPIVAGGHVDFFLGDEPRSVALTRAHLEEDAGKSLHENFEGLSGIDLNRAGTPLLEIVTEPDMRSSKEAVAYARELHKIVTWMQICDGNMQEGSFRCDANVSVRKPGAEYGTRTEIKNLNSFEFMEKAIDYEVRRQIELIEDGGKVIQETRLYDPDRDETRSMRSKEDAHDYRYFPDPDLPPLVIKQEQIDRIRASMPELRNAMAARFVRTYGTSEYDASLLTSSHDTADYFEAVMNELVAQEGTAGTKYGQTVANWINGEISARLNQDERFTSIRQSPVSAWHLVSLVRQIANGTINGKIAKEKIIPAIWKENLSHATAVDDVIERDGLKQITDSGAIEKIIDEVIAANAKNVEEFRAGKDKAFQALVGQAMKATKGKANPQQVNELLRKKLSAS
jgi:aspartyl-tRNA(Asn)/glutamyl-tRNA(Gln) amidotransferase subunit B